MQDRWRKVPGVQFHHLGQIQFRDTPEEYTLLQVNSERSGTCQRNDPKKACCIMYPSLALMRQCTLHIAQCCQGPYTCVCLFTCVTWFICLMLGIIWHQMQLFHLQTGCLVMNCACIVSTAYLTANRILFHISTTTTTSQCLLKIQHTKACHCLDPICHFAVRTQP